MAYRLLLKYLVRSKGKLLILAISLFINISMLIIIPIIIGRLVDYMVGKNIVLFDRLNYLLVIFLLIIFLYLLSILTNNIIQEKILEGLLYSFREDIIKKVLKIDLRRFNSYQKGDILSRTINDVDNIVAILRQSISSLIIGVFTIISTIITIIIFNYKLAILLIILTPIGLFISKFISVKSFKYFKNLAKHRAEMYNFGEEYVSTIKERKNYYTKQIEDEKFEEILNNMYKIGIKAQFYSSLPNPSIRFINSCIYLAVTMFCAYLVINSEISIGLMITFLKYSTQYVTPFNEISQVITQIQSGAVSLQRINEIIKEDDEFDKVVDTKEFEIYGDIELENISFSYNGKSFIKKLNLLIPRGSKIAIVGLSGSGKTTLANIIMGIYKVDEGRVLYNGIDIEDIPKYRLRNSISFVSQDSFIVSGTVRENIDFGRNVSNEVIIKAAKEAYADSFISLLPNGYDTLLGDSYKSLSQGEKQLICIARAMINTSKILILDEATSDIDSRYEIHVKKAFDKLMQGKTSIVIAHRLSTIKNSDLIIVMKRGNIVEIGKHDDLLAKNGEYTGLYKAYYE